MDLAAGTMLNMPFEGPVMEQPDFIMRAMTVARKCWVVHAYKPANRIPYDGADFEFTEWFLPEDYVPVSAVEYDVEAVKDIKRSLEQSGG